MSRRGERSMVHPSRWKWSTTVSVPKPFRRQNQTARHGLKRSGAIEYQSPPLSFIHYSVDDSPCLKSGSLYLPSAPFLQTRPEAQPCRRSQPPAHGPWGVSCVYSPWGAPNAPAKAFDSQHARSFIHCKPPQPHLFHLASACDAWPVQSTQHIGRI